MKCKTYQIGGLRNYKYVVTFAIYNGKWILCKHKKRDTWETAGGHIEQGESALEAARRELYEETGSLEFDIIPVCDYCVYCESHESNDADCANGVVFMANIYTLGEIPKSEMEKIGFFDKLPSNLTYPDITNTLFPYVLENLK
jgi:8-oxo-dGTP diphosphatase